MEKKTIKGISESLEDACLENCQMQGFTMGNCDSISTENKECICFCASDNGDKGIIKINILEDSWSFGKTYDSRIKDQQEQLISEVIKEMKEPPSMEEALQSQCQITCQGISSRYNYDEKSCECACQNNEIIKIVQKDTNTFVTSNIE